MPSKKKRPFGGFPSREAQRAYSRDSYLRNRTKRLANQKARRENNTEAINAQAREAYHRSKADPEWAARRRETRRQAKSRRRARDVERARARDRADWAKRQEKDRPDLPKYEKGRVYSYTRNKEQSARERPVRKTLFLAVSERTLVTYMPRNKDLRAVKFTRTAYAPEPGVSAGDLINAWAVDPGLFSLLAPFSAREVAIGMAYRNKVTGQFGIAVRPDKLLVGSVEGALSTEPPSVAWEELGDVEMTRVLDGLGVSVKALDAHLKTFLCPKSAARRSLAS